MRDDCVEIEYLIKGYLLQESRVIQLTTNGHNYSMPIDLLNRYRLQANPRIDATTSQISSTMNQRLNKLKIRYQNVGLAHMFELEFKQIIDEMSVASNEWLNATYFHEYLSEVIHVMLDLFTY
jgi:glutamate-1-semialdehyde aminotransferase